MVINPDAQPLLSVSVASARLLQRFSSLPVEQVPISDAGGRVLAQDLHAAIDLPPFANSSMDGFAVRAADIQLAGSDRPICLRVVADVPAGRATQRHLGEGEAIRIMTGAPVPHGADAVVPVEHTDFNDRSAGLPAPATVCISVPRSPGDYIRVQGEDVRAGELVLAAGHLLRPMEMGFLSMLGFSVVPVHRRPRVAIFSTGDELLPVEQPLTPGMIHDANSYTLAGLVREAGAEPFQLGIIPDDLQAVRHALQQAVDLGVDLILSSAGVSVGAFDFVRKVVEEHGELDFWRVNMRPGKPLAFGAYQNLPFVGLPGNPVSAYIGFLVFVRPAIWKMNGIPESSEQQAVRVEMAEPLESDGRQSYLRAVVSLPGNSSPGQLPTARLASHQGSGNLRSLVLANALLIIPSGVKSVPAGTTVAAWMLGDYQSAQPAHGNFDLS